MSNKADIVRHEEELMKGAYSWWKDAEEGEKVALVLYMRRTARRGVFELEIVGTDQNLRERHPISVKVKRQWPSSVQESLGALIFQMVTSIGRMIDEAAIDRVGAALRAPDRG